MSNSITTTATCSELRIASISDIHLGHARNEAGYIIQNLYQAFPDNSETGSLDILLVAGDLFDKSMMLSDDAVQEIDMWFLYILSICKKYNIMLIILEGTPSHDRGQPKRILHVNKISGLNADVLYVEQLSILYIERFDINVLFVPDECRATTDKILEDTLAMMEKLNLTKVDYAFMHGIFDFQVPEVAICEKHNSSIYLNLVDKLIFIGHDHTRDARGRIFVNGSFDRLVHGDEIPKGHYRACVKSATDFTVKFIENKNARIFKTIDVSGMDADKSLETIESVITDLKPFSFIRIKAERGNPVLGSILNFQRKWPSYNWSKIETTQQEDIKRLEKLDMTIYIPPEITPSNIVELVMARILMDPNVDEVTASLAKNKLMEVK